MKVGKKHGHPGLNSHVSKQCLFTQCISCCFSLWTNLGEDQYFATAFQEESK